MTYLPRRLLGSYGADRRFDPDYECNLLPSATRTANSTGSVYEMGHCTQARLELTITDVSGTNPTLDVYIETSNDETNWTVAGWFATESDAGTQRPAPFAACGKYIRAVSVLGGTSPSFTYSLTGRAV